VIEYAGRATKGAEPHYLPMDLEALAVVTGIRHFHRYLVGRKFTIYSDHQCLKSVFNNKNVKHHRILRWQMEIAQYDFDIIWRPGKKMGHADFCSRAPWETGAETPEDKIPENLACLKAQARDDLEPATLDESQRPVKETTAEGKEEQKPDLLQEIPIDVLSVVDPDGHLIKALHLPRDHLDVISMKSSIECIKQYFYDINGNDTWMPIPKPGYFMEEGVQIAMSEEIPDLTELSKIKQLQKADNACQRIYTFLKSEGRVYHPDDTKHEKTERMARHCCIKGGLLYHMGDPLPGGEERWRIFAPQSIIAKILTAYHGDPIAGGHYGFHKTFHKIAENFYWEGFRKDIEAWVKACQTCNEIKNPKRPYRNYMHPMKRDGRPFADISIDLSGRMPTSKRGHQYVLNVRCNVTRYLELFPMRSIDTGAIADVIFNGILLRYGAIERIHSDNGKQFTSALSRALADLVNTKRSYSTCYYPQSNGSVEASMYSTTISIYAISRRKGNWCDYLPCVMSAYNCSRCEATNCSPHLAVYGYDYKIPMLTALGIPETKMSKAEEKYLNEFIKRIRHIRAEAIRYNVEYQKKTKAYHDKKARPHGLQEGDKVFVRIPKPKMGYKKLHPKWEGPYRLGNPVGSITPPTTFEVLDERGRYKLQANVNQMKPHHDPPVLPSIAESQRLDDQEKIWDINLREAREFIPPTTGENYPNDTTEPEKETMLAPSEWSDESTTNESVMPQQQTANEKETTNKQKPDSEQGELLKILRYKYTRGKLQYQVLTKDQQTVWIAEEKLNRPDLIANFQHHTPPGRKYPSRSRIGVLGVTLPTLAYRMILATMILAPLAACTSERGKSRRFLRARTTTVMDFGTLYDCSAIRKEGLFGFNRISYCDSKENAEPKSFRAEVFQFRPEEKSIQIHLCRSYSVDRICTEKFFGSDKETSYTEEVSARAEQCTTALKNMESPRGHRIHRISKSLAKTRYEKDFKCTWMSTVDQRFFGYEIKSYEAVVRADEDVIHQALTTSKCRISEQFCIPKEDPKEIIVYDTIPALAGPYISLGIQEIVVAESLVSIPELGVGSSIDFRNDQQISLDGGYIIKMDENVTDVKKLKDYNKSFKHTEGITPAIGVDRLAGQTADATAMLESRIASLERFMCKRIEEAARIKQLLLAQFPDAAASLLSDERGTLIKRMGEGLLVSKCLPVTNYKVVHKRSVKKIIGNQTRVECYNDVPILVKGKTYFLDGVSRTLKRNGRRRNCSEEPDIMLFKNKHGVLLKLSRNGKWSKATQRGQYLDKHLRLPKFHTFNQKMKHFNHAPMPRFSLLEQMQESTDLMDQLNGMSEEKREALHEILGSEEGTVNLNKLAKGAQSALKKAGVEIEEGVLGMTKKILIWMGPLIGIILAALGFRKLFQWILRRRRQDQQRPVRSILVREGRRPTHNE
jgi:hypothetical protein